MPLAGATLKIGTAVPVLPAIVAGFAGMVLAMLWIGNHLLRRAHAAADGESRRLIEINAALERALKAQGDMLATTSHEIRTPLNGILGLVQVMLADRALDPAARERLSMVHGAGEQMRVLIDDILDVARLETGRMAISEAPLALSVLIEETARFWRTQAEQRGLELEVEIAACPPWIVGDQARLRQILFNLVSNALKFTPEGSIALSVAILPLPAGERLLIRVSDTGIGIAEDQQRLIFEKFHQTPGTARHGGTGLGLPICRMLAQAMDGAIDVASAPGAGAIFTLDLPLRRPAAIGTAESPAPAADIGEGRLLLVAANPLGRRVLAKGLAGLVATLDAVADETAAIARLRQGGFDHLLVELNGPPGPAFMPLLAAARAAGVRTLLLAVPDVAAALDRAALATLGVATVLTKPVAMKALAAALLRPPGATAAYNDLYTLAV